MKLQCILFTEAIHTCLRRFRSAAVRLLTPAHGTHQQAATAITPRVAEQYSFDRRMDVLIEAFAAAFPGRRDQLTRQDMEFYRWAMPHWKELFSHYDLLLGYSTDPILPLLADCPYLRSSTARCAQIPFEDDPTGRLTALAYHMAEHVFVTNSDCYENGRRLAADRVTFLNHPFDDDHSLAVTGINQRRTQLVRELDADFLIFLSDASRLGSWHRLCR